MKYPCIARHVGHYPETLMCRVLEVSRSGFYAAQTRQPSHRAQEDEQLEGAIQAIFQQSRQRYGSPRIHAELRAQGRRCSRKRVARLMRAADLRAYRPRRRRPRTTDSSHLQPVTPNHLERQFAVEAVPGPDRVWCADITYLPTRQGWLYLAVVLDLASRLVVGWAMKTDAHEGARHRRPADGLVAPPSLTGAAPSFGPRGSVCRLCVPGSARHLWPGVAANWTGSYRHAAQRLLK